MALWNSLKFGANVISLQSVANQPLEDTLQMQRERLAELVNVAREKSPHFRQKFSAVGADFQLADLPTSSKTELMDNFDAALTVDDLHRDEVEQFFEDPANMCKYFRDKYVLSHTSGSQGQALLLVQTRENVELLFALQASRGNRQTAGLMEVAKHMVSPARLAAILLQPDFYPSAMAFEHIPEAVKDFIQVKWLSITDEHLLEELAEFRPTHLTAYASILHVLARHIEEDKISFQPELKQIVNISELLLPETRKHYEEIFGAPILDDYGMGECTFLTNGCSTTPGMHVNADWAILEVVDDSNQPVPAGTPGTKVLVTNLANHVQPIIRYEVGDIATMAAHHCDCGSQLPLVERIEGRTGDMFHIQTDAGERLLSPHVFEFAFAHVLNLREFQLVQEDDKRIHVRMEPLNGQNVDVGEAERVLREHLAEYGLEREVELEFETVDRLATDGDAKFQRVVKNTEPAANSS